MLIPLYGGGQGAIEQAGNVTASSNGTAITAHATPGTDGAYTQLIAATARQTHALSLRFGEGGTVTGRALIDLAIGGAGSEQIILADIPHIQINAAKRCPFTDLWVPLAIPAGVRLAARVHRASAASLPLRVACYLMNGGSRYFPPFHRATTYGTDLANARGTSVDPGGTANTQGGKVQLVASTTNPIKAAYLLARRADAAATATTIASMIQLFVGAGGSEVAVTPEIWCHQWNDTADHESGAFFGPFPVNIPAGSRLSAAARSSNNTAGVREAQVSVLGLD